MSAIIDALKKTQSAINKKPDTDHSLYGDIETLKHDQQDFKSNAERIFVKIKSYFSFFSYRVFLSLLIIVLLCSGTWLGYSHDLQIMQGIHKITQIFKATPKTIAPALPNPHATLTLDGTAQVGNQREAMINQHFYQIGDTITGYQIQAIDENQVTLRDMNTLKTSVLTTNLD